MSDSEISLFTAIGTWAAVAGALVAVWTQNRTAARLLRIQLSLQVAAQYDSDLMQAARARLAATLLADRNTESVDDSISVFFENIAHLSRRGLLDNGVVWNIFSIDAPHHWHAMRNQIIAMRIKYDDKYLFLELERWVDTIVKAQLSPMGTWVDAYVVTDASVVEFLRSESRRRQPLTSQIRKPLNRRRLSKGHG